MNQLNFSEKSILLTDISPYIYGTTRLGDESIPFADRVEIAKAAIDTGVWLHTSDQYNNATSVLKDAMKVRSANSPKFIVKLGGNSMNEFENSLIKNLDLLGIREIEMGQLCIGGELALDFAKGGDCYRKLEMIRKTGTIKRFVLEVFPWTSDIAYEALREGYTAGLVDGFIFYF